MKKLILATVVALGMFVSFDGRAGAQWNVPACQMLGMGYQAPMGWGNPYQAPMDMSWAIQSQMSLQQCGDGTAVYWADAYLQYMNGLRINGYTGPSEPTGITTEQLQRSANALNRQYQVNNESAWRNSAETFRAIDNYDYRAIRGCYPAYDVYGRPYSYCP